MIAGRDGAMAKECNLMAKCGFFNKYRSTKELVCIGSIRQYCMGPKLDECKRKEHRKKTGSAAPEDMMPSGEIFAR